MKNKILAEQKFHIIKDGEQGEQVRWLTLHFQCDPLTMEKSLTIENQEEDGNVQKMVLWEQDMQLFCDVIRDTKFIMKQ